MLFWLNVNVIFAVFGLSGLFLDDPCVELCCYCMYML